MSDPTITWPGHRANEASRAAKATERIAEPAVILSNGKGLRAFGDEIFVHLGGAETGGRYTLFTDVTPPGGGPAPHYHDNEDEK